MVNEWLSIEHAPKDRLIWVYAPEREGLPAITCPCHWHPDGGFCVDELRSPTLYQEMVVPEPPPRFTAEEAKRVREQFARNQIKQWSQDPRHPAAGLLTALLACHARFKEYEHLNTPEAEQRRSLNWHMAELCEAAMLAYAG